MQRRFTRLSSYAAGMVFLSAFASASAANYCGELKNGYGPFDYRKRAELAQNFETVESAHFTPDVEAGIRGNTGTIGGDLDYTLRAIPNHARALSTMSRVGVRMKKVQLPGAKFPIECYFDRAIRLAPDDGAVRALWGSYLLALGQNASALKQFASAVELSPDDATINYNAGLAYLSEKNYTQANLHAQKAYQLGFPLPGLKNRLVQAGKWVELPAAPAKAPEGGAPDGAAAKSE